MDKFDTDSNKLVFEFENTAAANHFKHWLCGAGEQDYWDWMNYRESEEDGSITGLDFDYWSGETIGVKCGRQDDK
jgi:hypothetical protein